MQKLLLFSIVFFASLGCFAQPQHIGALANFQFEGSASGNGTITGLEIQSIEHLRIKGQPFKLATNASFTIDKKVYRNQFGGAIRATSLLRYAESRQRLLFVQGGVQLGGVAFPNTPGTSDGYVKYIARPAVGGGVDVTRDNYSVVVDYQFHFKRALYSQGLPVRVGASVLDGWTSGQRVGVAATFAIPSNPNWLVLVNGAGGGYTYQRNAAVYGAALGSVVHRFNAYEISVGIGRKY